MHVLLDTVLVSAASAWEIATKVRLGKLPTAVDLAADFGGHLDREGFQVLPISGEHAIRAGRMLTAQSQAENLALVSIERVFDSFGVRRIW